MEIHGGALAKLRPTPDLNSVTLQKRKGSRCSLNDLKANLERRRQMSGIAEPVLISPWVPVNGAAQRLRSVRNT
jgi:hypothetical protein